MRISTHVGIPGLDTRGGGRPTLNLNFVGADRLDPQITFTRASTATYFNSAGVLTSAAINTPRFDYNPATLAARGLLIEEQRTNLLLQSQDFGTTWTTADVTLTTDDTTSPDGTVNADSILENATTARHYIQQPTTTISGGATLTGTVFLKNKSLSSRFVVVWISSGVPGTYRIGCTVDLVNGTVSAGSSAGGGTTSVSTPTITSVGNGWYRVSLTGNLDVSVTSATLRFGFSNSSAAASIAPSYLGDGTSAFYLWGAQLEAGAFPTSYIPTTTTALTRSADVASVNTLTPWFNATEGTLFAQAEVPVITQTGRTMASIGRAVASAYELYLNITSTGAPGLPVATILAATTQFQYQPTPERFSTKGALAYKENDSQAAFDGTASATDTSVTLPDMLATLYIGKRDDITPLNGWLKRVTYYPRRLSQAELESITA